MKPQLRSAVDTRCLARSVSSVHLVMTIRAKRDGVIDAVCPTLFFRDYVVQLHFVEKAANTAMAAGVGEQLFRLVFLKSHRLTL